MDIGATISKNSYAEEKLREIVRAGATILRYNFSHGEPNEVTERINVARKVIEAEGKTGAVRILADLPGNKIRLGSFEPSQLSVERGDLFTFVSGKESIVTGIIPVDFPSIGSRATVGGQMFMGDGELSFIIDRVIDDESFVAIAENAGQLVTFSGATLPGALIDSMEHVTERTLAHIANLPNIQPEIVAFSFVRSKIDVERLKNLVKNAWPEGNPLFMAKIETPEGVKNIDEISEAIDWVMVARGDLALTTPYYALGVYEQDIIHATKRHSKKVMVATQVLSSLVASYIPTRAEISSLSRYVADGVDAVLLTKETGISLTPGHSVEVARKIITYTEEHQ